MAGYAIGSLIKRLRKQRGLTQEELAYPIVDRATLSRIESGKVMPSKKSAEALLERLGYNPSNVVDLFLDSEMEATQKIMNEIDSYPIMRPAHINKKDEGIQGISESDKARFAKDAEQRVARVNDLIQELEASKKFMDDKLNLQYILFHKGINSFISWKEDSEKILEILTKALKITIPEYDEKYLQSYYLSKQEYQLINAIALQYSTMGDHDKCIGIYYALKNNIKNHTIDQIELGMRYPAIASNLAVHLSLVGRPEEAIEVCEEAEKICRDTRFVFLLPGIVSTRAMALYSIGNKEESERLLRQTYYVAMQYGHFNAAEQVKAFMKDFLNKDI